MAQNQYPTVPLTMPDVNQHVRLISLALNNTVNGKLNSTGTVTLTASATTTTLNDARIGVNSFIEFMPTTSNGRTALNTLYIPSRSDGSCTLNHASSTATDQNLVYIIIG